jgi:ribosomal protein S18 acetylase RimI-like enzyme
VGDTFAMGVRQATERDCEPLHELYAEYFREVDTPAYWGLTLDAGLIEVDEIVADGLAFVAEDEGEIVGFVLACRREGARGLLSDIYVRAQARQNRHATRLTKAAADALHRRGATHLTLSVNLSNTQARAAYRRWGFQERTLIMDIPTEELRLRLAQRL